MKKSTIVIIIISVLLLSGLLIGSTYNNIKTKEELVKNKESDISLQLERRADLIPNLVNTVKGYAKHEEKIFEDVTKSRENLVNAKTVREKATANSGLNEALNKMFLIVENYPDLKASANFISLQDELAGTENRIAIARKNYNEAVKNYNSYIQKFPTNMIAKMFNFEIKEYFEAKESSNEVPNVSFE